MSVGIGFSKTAQTVFTKNVFQNFLNDGNQLRPILGTKFKQTTKSGDKIKFYITAEVLASKKPAVGSTVQQSKGTNLTTVVVKPETYVVATYLDEYEQDSTELNLPAEVEKIHARALGLEVDEIIGGKIASFPYDAAHKISIDPKLYEGTGTKKGWLDVLAMTNGIGRGMTKYLICDSAGHAKLMANEKFINNDYGTVGPVGTGSLDGKVRLEYKIVALEDLDPTLHGTTSLIEKVSGSADKMYVVIEESLCAGLHFADSKSTADKIPDRYNALLIQTHMSLGVEILAKKGMFEITLV